MTSSKHLSRRKLFASSAVAGTLAAFAPHARGSSHGHLKKESLISPEDVILFPFITESALAASSFLSIDIGFLVIICLTGKDWKFKFF